LVKSHHPITTTTKGIRMLSKAAKVEIAAEIERQLRAEKFAVIDRQLADHDTKEARPRHLGAMQMRAKVLAEGIAAMRATPPGPGEPIGIGDIRVAVPPPTNAEEADAVAVAKATEVARREIQTRRSVAAANAAGAAHLRPAPPDPDAAAASTFRAKVAGLIPRRSRATDPADEYQIG
jgi:hypothetical protein